MANATTDAVLDNARAALPGVADDVIKQALFNVCDDLAREALRAPAPASVDAEPDTWLPADQWVANFQSLLAGTLASLYGQFGKPYFQPDLAKANLDRYLAYRTLSRSSAAGAPAAVDTWPERLVSAVRVQITGVRDEAITLAMFAVVSEVRDEAYHYLTQSPGDPLSSWLSDTEFRDSYQAILYGTLVQLYGQANTAWYSLDQQKAQEALYRQELHQVRARVAAEAVATIHDRIVSDVRIHIPLIRFGAVELVMFGVVNDIRNEVYRLPALTTSAASDTWLTAAQYEQSYLAILYGTLARLFGQVGTEWFAADQQTANLALYLQELNAVRTAEAGAAASVDTIPERLVSSVRAEIPYAQDATIKLAMFGTVDRLRAEVYRLAPLTGANTDPTSWLTTPQYEQAFLAIQHGTLYRLYAQAGQPWFSNELSQAQLALYQTETISLRMVLAGAVEATDTIPERIVSTVRAQIQLVRDEAVKLEMFNIIQKIRDEAYQFDPLKGFDTDYTTWLTETQYEESYLAVLYGTLSRLYGQSNMPWFNLDLYGSNNVLFLQELDLVRSENVVAGGGIDGIISEARTYLPGASEEVMQIELRRCMDEFFKITQVWQGDVDLKVKPGKLVYELDCSACLGTGQIVRIISLVNSCGIGVHWYGMQNIPELTLSCEPSQKETFTARLCFSLLSPSGCSCTQLTKQCGPTWGVPDWILVRWNEVFFDGLLWRMMMQPAKPYTNTEIGLFHGQRWREGLADARGAAKQQNVYDGQRWRYPAFA